MTCTYDLRDFGFRELRLASELLAAHGDPSSDHASLSPSVHLGFNRDSGCVFLEDEDYRVAMMCGETLEEWHSCHQCAHEGFAGEFFGQAPDPHCAHCGVLYFGPLA